MYTAKGQLDANAMLKQYSPLVRRLAHQMIAKLPANVELDDLIQVGMIGLTDALQPLRRRAGRAVRDLRHPAHPRRDARRAARQRLDVRGDRAHQRAIESAVHRLEQQLGRAPQRERDRRARWA